MYKVLFNLLVLCFCSLNANSQSPLENSGTNSANSQDGLFSDNVATSINSPTASGFKNNVQYPDVSNTGGVNINIPLYTIQDRGLSFPIVLSYNPNNVKVDSKASWVGTGWNLFATGAITRTVKDLPDDALYSVVPAVDPYHGVPTYLGWLNNDLEEGSRIKEFPESEHFSHYNATTTTTTQNITNPFGFGRLFMDYRSAFGLVRDLEPDVYTFSVGSEQFSFVFNENGEPKILGLNDYKIEYTKQDLLDYSVQYELDEGGEVSYFNSLLMLTDYKQIITDFVVTNPSGYKYYFNYSDTEKTKTIHKKYMLNIDAFQGANNPDVDNSILENEEPQAEHITAWYLSKIVSPSDQEMAFAYNDQLIIDKPKNPVYLGFCETGNCTDEDRNKYQILDDTNFDRRSRYEVSSKYISEIETDNVKVTFQTGSLRLDSDGGSTLGSVNVISKISNKTIFSYDLEYSYTTASDCSNALDAKWCKRLFLDKIVERHGTVVKDAYDFEYNDAFTLPSRFSYQQDFWGYFNANNANSLIPQLYVYPNKSAMERYRIYPNTNESLEYILPGANRDVNDQAILAGTLKKVIFPTKGFREYSFEPNEYFDEEAQQTFKGGGLRIKSVKHNDGDGTDIVKSYDYIRNVSGSQQSSGKLYVNPVYGVATNYFRLPGTTIYNYMGVYRSVNYTPSNLPNISGFAPAPITFTSGEANPDFGDQNYVITDYDHWDKYTKRGSHSFNKSENSNGSSVLYTDVVEYIEGNGRVEHKFYEPTTYDIHQTEIQKGFQSSSIYGNIATNPNGFFNGQKCSFYSPNYADGLGTMFTGNLETNDTNPSYSPLDNNQGTLGYAVSPFPPMSRSESSLEYFRDKKQSVTVYSEDGLKLKEKLFLYETFRDEDEMVYGIVFRNYETLCNNYYLNQNWFAWAKYHYITNAEAQLSEVITRSYDQGDDTRFHEKIDKMYYDNHPENSLLTRTEFTDSKGDSYETRTFYPNDDEAYTLPNVPTLLSNHRIDTPIRQEIKKEGTILITKENEYSDFGYNNISKKRVLTSKGSGGLEEGTVVDLRDEYGNITQYRTKDDVYHVTLWDYNKSYTVMTIDNVTYSQVNTSLQSNTGKTLDEVIAYESEASMISWQNDIRDSLVSDGYNVEITSYTYAPLVGVTSITDTRGYTTYYTYDDFNRLQFVKDNDGNILSENRYNYKN
ncbi:hypothetical protein [Winogradskyella sp. 4-2091]|uniref:hypothetical protein n=1 Tax=Winogradskyella sp. 4-2091 TaxID=3381659 RepID=UPI0038913D64